MTKKLAMTLAVGSMLAIGCTGAEDDGSNDNGGDKADQIDGRDDPSGLLGPAERRLAMLISSADVGQSFGVPDEKAPYPDTYWPMGGDDIAPDGNGIAVEWVNKDGTQCFQRNDCDDPAPSPLAKYTAMVDPANLQAAIDWEVENHGTGRAGVLSWFGHCPGWVASTLLHLPVTEPLSVSFDGQKFAPCTRGSDCTKFEIGDINALSAEIHEGAQSRFIGARCDTEFEEDEADDSIDIDSLRDEFGRIVRNGTGCKGLNAGAMLILMGNRLKNDQLPFAIDAQNEFNTEQIWNQPAYRYTVNRFRTLTRSQATHLVASGGESETSSSLSGDEYIFNSNAKGWAFVDFTLHWVTETAPNVSVISGVDSTNTTRMVAVIELDADPFEFSAEIIGGEYLDDASVGADRLRVAPFAWIALDSASENGSRHNPFVSPALVKQLLTMTDAASAGNDGRAPDSCAHDLCSTGSTLAPSCDSCAASICAVDSFCCDNSWDSLCVSQVSSVCGQTCN